MKRQTEEKIILVTSMTRLEYLKKRFNSVTQAKFYVEHLGADFNDYLAEDELYREAFAASITAINQVGRLQVIQRQYLPNFIFGKKDIVVVLGRDGLVANTLKYLNGQPCIGVNPDPGRWDGILLPFKAGELHLVIPGFLQEKYRIKEVTMVKATLQNGEYLYGVNDLFIGAQTHISARYSITHGEKSEQHSSSGIIISTGLGSTAWLKSIIIGASKIVNELTLQGTDRNHNRSTRQNKNGAGTDQGKNAGPQNVSGKASLEKMNWDADYLYFSVREPFPSMTSSTDIVFGKITREKPLRILSYMPDSGVIFSDGIEKDYISFTSGMKAVISIAEKKGRLVV
ncbi:MAG: sugar kinase [Spirochaetales bacterium]|nr:sugar kinase [Spirochaetales bacterium]